jgi:hypothetical protein
LETTSKSESDNSKEAVENEEGGCNSIEQKLAIVQAKILKKAE